MLGQKEHDIKDRATEQGIWLGEELLVANTGRRIGDCAWERSHKDLHRALNVV